MTRFKGKPTEFDIYEGYVEYKVAPFFHELKSDVILDAKGCHGWPRGLTRLEGKLASIGRSAAMITSLSLAQGITRSMVGEDSDIVFADSYLCALHMLLADMYTIPNAQARVAAVWKEMFNRDVSYLIVSPDREVAHLCKKGWDALAGLPTSAFETERDLYFIEILGRVSRARLRANWRPYESLRELSDLSADEKELYEFHNESLISGKFPFLASWREAVRQVTETMQTKGSKFWLD